jgi:Serine hydroxymethyltransferase
MHVIARQGIAFEEALRPDFKVHGRKVVENARALAEAMVAGGLDLVSGGTDTHPVSVDLRPKGLTGRSAEALLGPRWCGRAFSLARSAHVEQCHQGRSPTGVLQCHQGMLQRKAYSREHDIALWCKGLLTQMVPY